MREQDIKDRLRERLNEQWAALGGACLMEELRVAGGSVRADLVDVRSLHCFEIKSEADTLDRLLRQGACYGRTFRQVTLVCAERHWLSASRIIPAWWGGIHVCDDGTLRQVRAAGFSSRNDVYDLATILTREECLDQLTRIDPTKRLKRHSLYVLQELVAQAYELNDLQEIVIQHLLHREDMIVERKAMEGSELTNSNSLAAPLSAADRAA